jgi:hypothetical protein
VLTSVSFCSAESSLSFTGSKGIGLYFLRSMGNLSKSQSWTFCVGLAGQPKSRTFEQRVLTLTDIMDDLSSCSAEVG